MIALVKESVILKVNMRQKSERDTEKLERGIPTN